MKATFETLIIPIAPCCICGVSLETRQERADGICRTCADAPAVSAVRPDVIGAYAMTTVNGGRLGHTLDALTATVEAWNTRPGDYAP